MRDRLRTRRPAHALAAISTHALPTLALLLLVGDAAAFPTHPGKWTTTTMNWNSTAINMVLLPGGPSAYHSRVLWWNHDDMLAVGGGLWGWSVPNDSSVNAGTFPVSHFADLDLEDPPLHAGQPNNIFCTGMTMLADSAKLLITGGTALGEGGTRSTIIFNSLADSNGAWVSADSMKYRRWYSDNTLLPNGKVVTVTGSSSSHYATVGGMVEALADTATRMLQLYNVSYDNEEAQRVVPTQFPGTPPVYPSLLPFYDTGAAEIGISSMFMFGGRDSGGQPRLNAIRIQRERNAFHPDYWFQWTELTQSPVNNKPTERAGAAVVSIKNSNDVLVIGGTDGTAPFSEVWRGQIVNNGITWTKLTNNLGPNALPALHGLSAIYASDVNRVFVFGGSSTTSDTPTNMDVYSIQLNDTVTSNTLWVTKAFATGDLPGPRSYGSLTYFKNPAHGMPGHTTGTHYRAMLFGGKTVGGAYADTLSSMWITSATAVTWERVTPDIGPKPTGRARHAAAVDPNSQWLVVSGGETAAGTSSAALWAFDLTCGPLNQCDTGASNHWEQLHDLPLPVRGHCAAVLGPEPAFPRLPEVFSPDTRSWSTLLNSPHWQEWYSFGFAAPRGPSGDELRVFYAGPEDPSSMLHLSHSTPDWTTIGNKLGDWRAGSAVMYRPGKVMKCGTRDTGGVLPVAISGASAVIDLTATNPNWVLPAPADTMIHRRNHNLVILPNGEVVVIGGARWGGNEESTNANCVRMPQIWSPDTLPAGHWYGSNNDGMVFDASSMRRHYHTSAILLPDARVLVAGGNNDSMQVLADIYSPYYLFNTNGTTATRPVIMQSPVRVSYGERFALCMGANDNALSKVSLVRPASTTHGFDQNQRFVPLTFESMSPAQSGQQRFLVSAPADSFDAPPGDYMLFALNPAGTPSIARWIQLRATNLDTDPPTMVTNLHKVCGHGTWVELEWTPPYEDQAGGSCPGPAAVYDMRVKLSSMSTESDFANATPAGAGPAPADPYLDQQSMGIYGLQDGTRYYFRMKSKDYSYATGNWSAMSNELTFVLHDESCGGSGGGGGCCHEEGMMSPGGASALWARPPGEDGGTDPSFLENTLLANVPLDVAKTDVIRLEYGPKWTSTGARIRLSQAGAFATRFDRVRLLGVALAPGGRAFVFGDQVMSGTLTDPVRVSHADGRDLTKMFAADSAYDGRDGDTLYVEFADATPARIAIETSRAQLVIEPDRTGIEIQCGTAQGWQTVAHHDPREVRSEALCAAPSPARMRLIFMGEHRLHGIARFVPGAAATVTAYSPTGVLHSRLGEVAASLGTGGAVLAAGENMLADFGVTQDQAAGLDWMLEVTGTHVAGTSTGGLNALLAPRTEAPLRFALERNRPNPFGTDTRLGFEVPVRASVKLEVFDLLGRRVATLANAAYEPGRYTVSWDRRGNSGERVPAGVYTCRFTAGNHQEQRRMIVYP